MALDRLWLQKERAMITISRLNDHAAEEGELGVEEVEGRGKGAGAEEGVMETIKDKGKGNQDKESERVQDTRSRVLIEIERIVKGNQDAEEEAAMEEPRNCSQDSPPESEHQTTPRPSPEDRRQQRSQTLRDYYADKRQQMGLEEEGDPTAGTDPSVADTMALTNLEPVAVGGNTELRKREVSEQELTTTITGNKGAGIATSSATAPASSEVSTEQREREALQQAMQARLNASLASRGILSKPLHSQPSSAPAPSNQSSSLTSSQTGLTGTTAMPPGQHPHAFIKAGDRDKQAASSDQPASMASVPANLYATDPIPPRPHPHTYKVDGDKDKKAGYNKMNFKGPGAMTASPNPAAQDQNPGAMPAMIRRFETPRKRD